MSLSQRGREANKSRVMVSSVIGSTVRHMTTWCVAQHVLRTNAYVRCATLVRATLTPPCTSPNLGLRGRRPMQGVPSNDQL